MATILFYSPFNNRSRDTESLMIAFKNQGHRVISLTQQEGHSINDFLQSQGIEAYSHVVNGKRGGLLYLIKQARFFVGFCRQHKCDVVYCHLEPANFVGAIGQFFIRASVYLCRHHVNEAALYNFQNRLSYRLTYWLARRIIVVSRRARDYMIEYEKIDGSKISHINLAYDFGLYKMPSVESVKRIRQAYPCRVLLVVASRLTKYKRPNVAIETLERLIREGIDAKLVLLGQGEMTAELERRISESNLEDKVFLPGFVENVLDFLAASDFVLHPSLLESSCVAVKEAGLASRVVIACAGIGDFDEYMVNGYNGFLVDNETFSAEATAIIQRLVDQPEQSSKIGKMLREDVLRIFSVHSILHQYDELNGTIR